MNSFNKVTSTQIQTHKKQFEQTLWQSVVVCKVYHQGSAEIKNHKKHNIQAPTIKALLYFANSVSLTLVYQNVLNAIYNILRHFEDILIKTVQEVIF